MATIKEMAEQYGKVNYIVRYTADGDKEIDEDTCAEAFEDGANAVLEEIEKIVKYDKDPHCIEFLKERIWRLKEK